MNLNKNFFAVAAVFAAAACFAAPAGVGKTAAAIPYSSYEDGMRTDAKNLSAVEWQKKEDKAITKAVEPATLAAIGSDAAKSAALLALVNEPYKTPPLAATQIAAISQLAMVPGCDKAPALREKWTAALIKAAKEAKTSYAKLFHLDQLRWCGYQENAKTVREIGAASSDHAVKDFAAVVSTELEECAK